jgi:hypothetical protein
MSWINLSALWKIVVYGLLLGAGLPAAYAVGLFSLTRGPRTRAAAAGGGEADVLYGGSILGAAIAAIIFLGVLAAIGWGVWEVYQIGHPAPAHK